MSIFTMAYPALARKRAAFTPTDIAGLVLWLDAANITGLNDGDPVATWPDASDEANDATQATEDYRPTYQTNELNGKPVVRFDGSNDWLVLDTNITASSVWTCFHVLKKTGSYMFGVANHDHAHGATAFNSWINDQLYVNDGTKNYYVNSQLWTSHTIVATKLTGGTCTGWRNGITLGAFSASSAASEGVFNSIGKLNTNYSTGDIAEIIIYNSALSDGDRGDVESYLSTKYNIALS